MWQICDFRDLVRPFFSRLVGVFLSSCGCTFYRPVDVFFMDTPGICSLDTLSEQGFCVEQELKAYLSYTENPIE